MQAADRRRILLDLLGSVPDLRGRQGRRYPIGSLLAVLILAAMNGESSLLGMWPWARAHAELLTARLSFHRQRIPALETSRTIVCQLDRVLLLEAFNAFLASQMNLGPHTCACLARDEAQ
jgi:hypothetical protein